MTSGLMKSQEGRMHKNQNSDIDIFSDDYDYAYGFHSPARSVFKTEEGLVDQTVREISSQKEEPEWMLSFRLKALEYFNRIPMPSWGPDLSNLDFNDISYYNKPVKQGYQTWEEVPEDIKTTFDKLGVPEAERKFLAGLGAQYDSEMVYHRTIPELEKQGVIFCDPETALKKYPEIFCEYFATVVPIKDNKFSALNSAFWSGGSFVYVPKGVKLSIPVQSYFRINSQKLGQFERTLIIAEEDSFVHYIEGCTAPSFTTASLHSAVVEIIAKKGARVRYSTVQNWSHNVYNLVTKRAIAYENAVVEWVDGNIGSHTTMKYPAIILAGEGARGEVLSIAFAKEGQIQDTGAKMIHLASNTSSRITSKSISKNNGLASYRGLIAVEAGLKNIKSKIECDALLLNKESKTATYPYMDIRSQDTAIEHEATVSRLSEEKLFYLMSRGLNEEEASMMVVSGFIDPLVKELPMEFALELNRLIQLEMEGSVG